MSFQQSQDFGFQFHHIILGGLPLDHRLLQMYLLIFLGILILISSNKNSTLCNHFFRVKLELNFVGILKLKKYFSKQTIWRLTATLKYQIFQATGQNLVDWHCQAALKISRNRQMALLSRGTVQSQLEPVVPFSKIFHKLQKRAENVIFRRKISKKRHTISNSWQVHLTFFTCNASLQYID